MIPWRSRNPCVTLDESTYKPAISPPRFIPSASVRIAPGSPLMLRKLNAGSTADDVPRNSTELNKQVKILFRNIGPPPQIGWEHTRVNSFPSLLGSGIAQHLQAPLCSLRRESDVKTG